MATILIADDMDGFRNGLSITLRARGHRILLSADGQQALACARLEIPDLIILDCKLALNGKAGGLEVCNQLRTESKLPYIPILFTLINNSIVERIRALDAGVDDVISKSLDSRELCARVDALIRMKQGCGSFAHSADNLVLPNKEAFHSKLAIEFADAQENTKPLSVMMLSLAKHSKDNQNIPLPKLVKQATRPIDFISNFSPIQIAVILPNTSFMNALSTAEKIANTINTSSIFGVNIGVSCYPGRNINSANELVLQAQQSLELASKEGTKFICLQHHQTYLYQPNSTST